MLSLLGNYFYDAHQLIHFEMHTSTRTHARTKTSILTICELSLISEKSLFQLTVGTFPFFFSVSLILATNSARFLRADVDNPVVKMPTSILPDNGSVADCFNASRCNLMDG